MRGGIRQGTEVGNEEVVIEVQVVSDDIVGSITGRAGDVVPEGYEGLGEGRDTPRMNSCV